MAYEGFKAVEESAARSGADDPAAVAAAVGRKKYGAKRFNEAAAKGENLRGAHAKGSAQQRAIRKMLEKK